MNPFLIQAGLVPFTGCSKREDFLGQLVEEEPLTSTSVSVSMIKIKTLLYLITLIFIFQSYVEIWQKEEPRCPRIFVQLKTSSLQI